MTLEETVQILNAFRYRGLDCWIIRDGWIALPGETIPRYSSFEATAISEKLLYSPSPHQGEGLVKIVCALLDLTRSPLDSQGQCRFCGSSHKGLYKFIYDPKFHLPECPLPKSREAVAPIDLCSTEELVELERYALDQLNRPSPCGWQRSNPTQTLKGLLTEPFDNPPIA